MIEITLAAKNSPKGDVIRRTLVRSEKGGVRSQVRARSVSIN